MHRRIRSWQYSVDPAIEVEPGRSRLLARARQRTRAQLTSPGLRQFAMIEDGVMVLAHRIGDDVRLVLRPDDCAPCLPGDDGGGGTPSEIASWGIPRELEHIAGLLHDEEYDGTTGLDAVVSSVDSTGRINGWHFWVAVMPETASYVVWSRTISAASPSDYEFIAGRTSIMVHTPFPQRIYPSLVFSAITPGAASITVTREAYDSGDTLLQTVTGTLEILGGSP